MNEPVMTSPWWEAMVAVPRSLFIPDTIWHDTDLGLQPLRRAEQPDRWHEIADGGSYVVTQVNDGQLAEPGRRNIATSSVSMPRLVALMLDHLDLQEGHRVLEIGTGTGWSAALMAHRVGAEQVNTIEVDPHLAAQARDALSDAGFGAVTAVVGDGARGYPLAAPYDRLIATVAARDVPYAWVRQTRPGGRLVIPWANGYLGLLLALDVAEDGVAIGGVCGHLDFMLLRDQRGERGFSSTDDQEDQSNATMTTLHPSEVAYRSLDPIVAVVARVPQCRMGYYLPGELDDHDGILWLVDDESGSWARLHHDPAGNGPHRVHQYGPRALWCEVEAAYGWWVDAGSPGADRWRFTVTPQGQRIELVTP